MFDVDAPLAIIRECWKVNAEIDNNQASDQFALKRFIWSNIYHFQARSHRVWFEVIRMHLIRENHRTSRPHDRCQWTLLGSRSPYQRFVSMHRIQHNWFYLAIHFECGSDDGFATPSCQRIVFLISKLKRAQTHRETPTDATRDCFSDTQITATMCGSRRLYITPNVIRVTAHQHQLNYNFCVSN